MKYILFTLAAAAIMLATACTQTTTGFTMKGEFEAIEEQPDSVFIYDTEQRQLMAAPVVNGKFELKSTVDEPAEVFVTVKQDGGLMKMGGFILDNGNYTYAFNNWAATIKGGELHNAVLGFESTDEYKKAVRELQDLENNIFSDDSATIDNIPQEDIDKFEMLERKLMAIVSKAVKPLIENPNTPPLVKAYAVVKDPSGDFTSKERLSLLKECREKMEKSTRDLDNMIMAFEDEVQGNEMSKTVAEGMPFKDVDAKDKEGNSVKLSDIVAKNKFTILEFWASWCGPCRGEIPNLKKAYEKYKSKGLEIYAISLDEDNAAWLKALDEENTPWINVIDPMHFKGEAAKGYSVSGIPASYLIDQKGTIRASDKGLRGGDLEKTLSELMP